MKINGGRALSCVTLSLVANCIPLSRKSIINVKINSAGSIQVERMASLLYSKSEITTDGSP